MDTHTSLDQCFGTSSWTSRCSAIRQWSQDMLHHVTMRWNTYIICTASISWRTSSPTLKMQACLNCNDHLVIFLLVSASIPCCSKWAIAVGVLGDATSSISSLSRVWQSNTTKIGAYRQVNQRIKALSLYCMKFECCSMRKRVHTLAALCRAVDARGIMPCTLVSGLVGRYKSPGILENFSPESSLTSRGFLSSLAGASAKMTPDKSVIWSKKANSSMNRSWTSGEKSAMILSRSIFAFFPNSPPLNGFSTYTTRYWRHSDII